MIAKKLQLLTIAAFLMFPFGVRANDISPEFEFQLVNPTVNDIEIDGDLSEWEGAILIENVEYSLPKGCVTDPAIDCEGPPVTHTEWSGGEWDGPDDHSLSMQTLYDEDNLYISVVVTDDYHEAAAAVGGPGGAWNGDGVQMHFANDERDSQVALINFALPGEEQDPNFLPVCGFGADLCTIHLESGPAIEGDVEVVIVRDNTIDTPRTIYEVRVAKEAIGIENGLVPDISFGLGLLANDGDFDTPGQKGWSGLGVHSIVHGKTPQETAQFFLGEEVSLCGDVPGDANCDQKVDAMDLNILGGNWQMMVAGGIDDGDFNEDGTVNAADLNILGGNWQFGVAAPINAAVPEPSGLKLVILGCFLTLVIRRKR